MTRAHLRAYRPVVGGAIALAVVFLLILFDYTGALNNLMSGGGSTVKAIFANSKTLVHGDKEYVNGVPSGTVTQITPQPGARTVMVTMNVTGSTGTIHRDATAQVRWRTVLGGAFVVGINPGRDTSPALGGAPIPVSQTSSQVELDDITTVLQGQARSGLRTTITQLGKGFGDKAALGDVASNLARVAPDVTTGVGALRGQNPDVDLRNLVTSTQSAVQALNAPDDQVRTLISGAATTLDTTAARSGDIQQTLSTAPAAMDITNSTLTALDHTLTLANPLIAHLQRPAVQLSPALVQLHPVAVHAATLLDRAKPLLTRLRPAVRSLSGASVKALPLLNGLSPALNQLSTDILPYMGAIDPQTGHSAAEMVGSGAGGLALVAAPEDDNGHFLHFPATAGSSSVYLPCQTYIANPDESQIVACESLQQQLQTYLNYNPLAPAAGSGGGATSSPQPGRKAHR